MDQNTDPLQNQSTNTPQSPTTDGQDELQNLASRYADQVAQKPRKDTTQTVNTMSSENDTIHDLEAEIAQAFGEEKTTRPSTPTNDAAQKTTQTSNSLSTPNTEAIDDIPYPSVASKHSERAVTEQADLSITEQIPVESKTNETSSEKQTKESTPMPETNSIAELEAGIAEELARAEQTQQTAATKDNSPKGPKADRTYYGDLSNAMSSNRPETMSELLRRSDFEKKEKKILSPISRKNLLYTIGAAILLLSSIGIWFLLFGQDEPATFITDERVESLVYTDEDLGVNVTGLGAFETRDAIRTVLEREHPPENFSQVYYVENVGNGVFNRLGVKNIFDRTESGTPELVYDNIENNFMHGVYTTDQNYPFVIMKALSYDRAFQGMREWEPTLIDDMATYLDLPDTALDRSLLQDGFEDDLIKNKNVRVARFIPRASDQRGILDFLRSDGSEFEQNNEEFISSEGLSGQEVDPDLATPEPAQDQNNESNQNTVDGFANEAPETEDQNFIPNNQLDQNTPTNTESENFDPSFSESEQVQNSSWLQYLTDIFLKPWSGETVYAQNDIGGTFITDTINNQAGQTVCYRSQKICVDLPTGQQLPGNTTPSSSVICYDEIFTEGSRDPANPDFIGRTYTPEEVGSQPGFVCQQIVGGVSIVDPLFTDDICFNRFTGERTRTIPEGSPKEDVNDICFQSYQCRRRACFLNGQQVLPSQESAPGVECRITDEVVPASSTEQKACTSFTDLLRLENISSINLCFDENGKWVPTNRVQTDQNGVRIDNTVSTLNDYYRDQARQSQRTVRELLDTRGGLICVAPEDRYLRTCLLSDQSLIPGVRARADGSTTDIQPGETINGQRVELCFEELPVATGEDTSDQFRGLEQDIRQRAASIALKLEFIAQLASVGGLFPNGVADTLREAANVFWDIANGNILENEVALRIAEVARTLEELLDQIDPGAPDSQVVLELRTIIAYIRTAVGLEFNVAWVTLGNRLPLGTEIRPGQVLETEEQVQGVEALQQMLVLVGLMDPISVTGELDLVTQEALGTFQALNGLGSISGGEQLSGNSEVSADVSSVVQDAVSSGSVFLDAETMQFLFEMSQGAGSLFGGQVNEATIDDYFAEPIGLGSYREEVQRLQIILYVEGFTRDGFDGIFDAETCRALREYQEAQGLEVADENTCQLSDETIDFLNQNIRDNNYLGSGFVVGEDGTLIGSGEFGGIIGPGGTPVTIDPTPVEAGSLREGDIVLMYTFLDEETILITRHENVITEVIGRRALEDIFAQ